MPTLSSSKLIKSRIKFMTTYRVPPTISPEAIKYKDDTNNLKDKEIKFIPSSNKLFIKDVTAYSGYEIGDYVDEILISKDNDGKIIDIQLELSKNQQVYKTKFTVDIVNFEGENI